MDWRIRHDAKADEVNALAFHTTVVRNFTPYGNFLGKLGHLRYLVKFVCNRGWPLECSAGSQNRGTSGGAES